MAPFTLLAGVLTYIWPFVHSEGGYIAVACVYGCVIFPAKTLIYLTIVYCKLQHGLRYLRLTYSRSDRRTRRHRRRRPAYGHVPFGPRHRSTRGSAKSALVLFLICLRTYICQSVSGAIFTATQGYEAVGIYAGSAVVVSVVLMWVARCLALGGLWGKF